MNLLAPVTVTLLALIPAPAATAMQLPLIRPGNGIPGDTVAPGSGQPDPEAPGEPGYVGGGAPDGPSTPGGVAPPTAGGTGAPTAAPLLPTTPPPSGQLGDIADWWIWWEMHKLDYLRPDREVRVISADDLERYGRPGEAERRTMVEALTEVAFEDLRDPRSVVRAAAALVVGRTAPDRAGSLLEPLLRDATNRTRHVALLGLGLTGRPEHVARLRDLLVGRDRAGRICEVTPFSPYFAGVALALARSRGDAAAIDTIVAHAAREIEVGRGQDPRTLGVLAYQRLAETDGLAPFALRVLADDHAGALLCGQAAEVLGRTGSPDVLAALTTALAEGSADLRRSALLGLGEATTGDVADQILAAYEDEAEVTTRGYALISLARVGGMRHGEYLRNVLEKGSVSVRPFAALAVGIHSRRFDDEAGRAALRKALEARQSSGTRGALVVASGIARDEAALSTAGHQLIDGPSQADRYHGALALGLICKPDTRSVLRECFASERSALARAGIALGLGLIGAPPDAALLAQALLDASTPDLRDQFTVALALHDTTESLAACVDVLASDERLDAASRAALLGAAGVLADDVNEGFVLGRVIRASNPETQPEWMRELWSFAF